ncbi:tyrosine-type recombinase/integrase [Acinetobacter sp. WCHAc010052]|uniref:tyrosine-type recombinase/integrase n=1 Tax=Acinetobacter sp. WCHAc010052 TaxID=2004647 RepID=UPI000B3CD3F6|nr:site-specific integrase [Acinetobacter sp. WCHAc010052]AXY59992.1 site-specific integrase [Acinetobacter sp. WCHAc010052]
MKLPKAIQRGSSWRITVTFQNRRYSATRDTPKECEHWASLKLLELKTGKADLDNGIKPAYPFSQLCEKYYQEHGRHMRSARTIILKIKNLERIAPNIAEKSIYDFKPADIVEWRNNRKKVVKVATVRNEHAIYSAIFTYAMKELFLIESNVWHSVQMPSKEKSRNQRMTLEDQQILLKALEWNGDTTPVKSKHYVAWAFLFAIETAMRQGEILAMRKADLREGFIYLPMTKNGESRSVPLSREAKRLLSLLPADADELVPLSKDICCTTWVRAKKRAGLKHINFHDSRHEAITRMVRIRKLPVEVLAKITGHKTIGILINTYYNPDAQDLVEMFNDSES